MEIGGRGHGDRRKRGRGKKVEEWSEGEREGTRSTWREGGEVRE